MTDDITLDATDTLNFLTIYHFSIIMDPLA